MTSGSGDDDRTGFAAPTGRRRTLARWLPLIVVVVAMVVAFASGLTRYLSFETLGLNFEVLRTLIRDHLVLALLCYGLVYIAVVTLSLPGALVMTVSGGLLFGWQLGAPAAIVSATVGASLIFLVARSSLGAALAERAGPAVERLREGFQANAFSYLLFLRLVPALPFFLVNLAPSLLGMPFWSYVAATFLGIIPATTAFAVAGSGLGSVVEAQNAAYKACLAMHEGRAGACAYSIDTSRLVTTELLLALAALGIVALIPVMLKPFVLRSAAKSRSRPDAT